MRWIWTWWHRRAEGNPEDVRRRREAERKLREVERMGDEVSQLADRLTHHLEVNNFAELVAAAFRGRR